MFYFSSSQGWITGAAASLRLLLWRQSRPIRSSSTTSRKRIRAGIGVILTSIQNIDEVASVAAAPAFVRLNQAAFAEFNPGGTAGQSAGPSYRFGLGHGGHDLHRSADRRAAWSWEKREMLEDLYPPILCSPGFCPSIQTLVSGRWEFSGALVGAQRMMDLLSIELKRDEGSHIIQ
jgi:hypothetical protein